jgi:circadian clock protein KaiB
VIDVLERPQLAENEKIMATPTLVKELPPPLRRVVGDLSNRERVLVGLDLAVREAIDEGKDK